MTDLLPLVWMISLISSASWMPVDNVHHLLGTCIPLGQFVPVMLFSNIMSVCANVVPVVKSLPCWNVCMQDRRKEMTKSVAKLGEDGKVSIRYSCDKNSAWVMQCLVGGVQACDKGVFVE